MAAIFDDHGRTQNPRSGIAAGACGCDALVRDLSGIQEPGAGDPRFSARGTSDVRHISPAGDVDWFFGVRVFRFFACRNGKVVPDRHGDAFHHRYIDDEKYILAARCVCRTSSACR